MKYKMLIKFPQISNNTFDDSLISFGETPYAKHNIVKKSTDKQVGFLTEHSLMFIIKGKKYFHFDGHTVCIKSNELILIKRGIYTISEFIPDNDCFEALIIFIPDKFLQTFCKQTNIPYNKTEITYTILKYNRLLSQFQSYYLNYFIENFQGKEELLNLKLQELFLLLQNADNKDK
ncbi:MAG: hypothetical protein HC905_13115 [Bacteroidales bacterium]|nr:hypothetical protein [Bacteroidales bacterium]